MLKRLAILAVFVAVFTVEAMSSQKQATPDKQQRSANQLLPTINETNNGVSRQEAESGHNSPQGWHKFVAWPEGVTVWAILATLGAIIWQSNETRHAAKAAYLQADVTKRKQRAHIDIVSLVDPPSSVGMVFTNQQGKKLDPVEVFIQIILDGESNAYNVWAIGCLSVTESKDVGAPKWPRLECPTVIREAPPSNPVRISLSPGGFGTFTGILQSEMDKVREGSAFLHAAGQILYDDVFGDGHVTPFHFVYYVVREGSWPPDEGWENMSGKAT